MESFRIFGDWGECLAQSGLDNFDALFGCRGGSKYRQVPGRLTVRISLPDPAGGERHMYLKRYTRVPLGEGLRRLFSIRRPSSLARVEMENIAPLAEVGIETLTPVAFGERLLCRGLRERSFFATEEISGGIPADQFFAQRFAGAGGPELTSAKRRLVCRIAELARRLHGGGFNHRDFYLCHILVRPADGGEPVLHLIDLSRVMRHGRMGRTRWLIKDIAAMNYSAASLPLSRTDRMRFARAYFGVRWLQGGHKRFLRRVLAKTRRIARHDARARARQGVEHL